MQEVPLPRPQRRTRSSELTRSMIVDAALAEFAESGYESATTASISRRVGVTQPLVHYHFGSKRLLWEAAVNHLVERLLENLRGSMSRLKGTGPEARLTGICYALVDFVIANPELPRIVNSEGARESDRLDWLVSTHFRPLVTELSRELQDARKAGVVRDIPEAFLYFILFGATQHFFDVAPLVEKVSGFNPGNPDTAKAFADSLVGVFLNGCGRREQTD
jgi:TetR/AcrR family transcriptional regulator